MFVRVFAMLLSLGFLALLADSAEACSRKVSKSAAQSLVPTKKIKQSLFSQAILVEVNFHRCRAGLAALEDAGSGLSKQAQKHSVWMAKSQTLSHKSNVSGLATLKQRLKKSGLRYRMGAENIGMVHRYQIDNKSFKILSSSDCKFATYEGQPLPAHSYASLARLSVDLWMKSPGHRKNILDKRAKMISTAVAFDPKAQYCGQFWLTQNFIG